VDAIGFNALDVDASDSFSTHCREQAAKVGAVVDVYVLRRGPKFLGPKIAIGAARQTEAL
jgi:SanA protein